MSVTSNRLNEVVKVLTIFSTLVLPLSLIASIYGMNFHHMPELGWRYGYPFALGLMGVVVVLLLVFFWRRGWLTNAASRRRAPPVILPRAAARLDAETRRRVRAKHAGPHEAPAADARVAATAPSRRG